MVNGVDANLEQIKAGMAWWYEKYRKEQSLEVQRRYAEAEQQARGLGLGCGVTRRPKPRGIGGRLGVPEMCTRYISPEQAEIEAMWHIGRHNQPRWARDLFPRALGPFVRLGQSGGIDLVVGIWGLIPYWSETPVLKCSTANCRSKEASRKPTFRDAWRTGQRCIIPALSFDEP
jgi:hypothetical protein